MLEEIGIKDQPEKTYFYVPNLNPAASSEEWVGLGCNISSDVNLQTI